MDEPYRVTLEHAQRNELVDGFGGLFRQDATWTTAHGKRRFGRDEIAAFTSRVLPGAMTDPTPTYRVEHVLLVRPDVAAVKVRQRDLLAAIGRFIDASTPGTTAATCSPGLNLRTPTPSSPTQSRRPTAPQHTSDARYGSPNSDGDPHQDPSRHAASRGNRVMSTDPSRMLSQVLSVSSARALAPRF